MVEQPQNLDSVYDPTSVEREVFACWSRAGAFSAKPDERGPDRRFVVMMPLPNVTGSLHLGHAINNTLQDIVTRWHRMRGFNSLYQPGTDHAGIATQAVVERRLFEQEGKTRHDLGRETLVRRIWEWKDAYQARILEQLQMMGCSCDWDRVRFTLDEGYNRAVLEMFYRWFKAGLIHRGKRLVNWDTTLRTAVADDEVYHKTVKGSFWHFKYPIKDAPPGGPTHLGFATTRPETMLGDTALAVHPDDGRYRWLVGKVALVPLFDPPREIPIIADEYPDPEKGTGCVKITPAHDHNDYEVGLRHDLPMISMMTADGRVSDAIREGRAACKYVGQTMAEARRSVVAEMESLGLLDKVEPLEVDLPHSDRSKSPIEPFLSDQWFVRMGDVAGGIELADGTRVSGLAQAAIDAVQDGLVRVIPERYRKTYLDWLSEKRDWCISRQLWWGHRIPVWFAHDEVTRKTIGSPESGEIISRLKQWKQEGKVFHTSPAIEDPRLEAAPDQKAIFGYWCPSPEVMDDFASFVEPLGFKRDDDVLDTWFSSQLWPFATIGWPEKTVDLDFYYPGTVLITSRDIITLWVARMVLAGRYVMGDVPFRDVYIHPKILDGRGETMSKSKGNGVDPLDIIAAYGADAMRYSLADMTTETQDVRMPVDYRCPHCEALTPQTVKNMQSTTIECKKCGASFATRWADDATAERLGRAWMVSDKFEIGRNFCNKLWNAARFVFMNIEGVGCDGLVLADLPTEDRWILAKLSATVRRVNEALGVYRFSASIKLLRDFFWDSLCDWYIELTKARLRDGPQGAQAKQILAFAIDQTLRMFHPFIPFITEQIWRQLNAVAPNRGLPGLAELGGGELLIDADFPPAGGWPGLDDADITGRFEVLQAATRGVREVRSRHNVPPKTQVEVTVNAPADRVGDLEGEAEIVRRLAGIGSLTVATDARRPKNAGTVVLGDLQIYVHDVTDDRAERDRLQKEIAAIEKQIEGKRHKLSNERFISGAKPEVVAAERERLAALESRRGSLSDNLAMLSAE